MDIVFSFFMRRLAWRLVIGGVLVVYSVTILFTHTVSAHTLKTDGAISAVLHFQPDDTPMSGKPTEYALFLNDSTKHFLLSDCDCVMIIEKDGTTISSKPMQLNSQNIIGGSITFPEAGAYEVTFQGAPANSGAFQPFTLKYLEQVVPNPDANPPSSMTTASLSILVVGIVVIAFLIKVRYNSLEGTKK